MPDAPEHPVTLQSVHASVILCGARGGAWLLNWWDDAGDHDESLAFRSKKAAVAYLWDQVIADPDVQPEYERLAAGHFRWTWDY